MPLNNPIINVISVEAKNMKHIQKNNLCVKLLKELISIRK